MHKDPNPAAAHSSAPSSASGPLDLDAFWMPFTANKAFKRAPRLLVSAKGMYYTAADSRRILDGAAGLWCVNAGHCREPIVAAIQHESAKLDYEDSRDGWRVDASSTGCIATREGSRGRKRVK